jgi:predicted glycoside hydrolase/deacetylase ChbG (UPF0249 family)
MSRHVLVVNADDFGLSLGVNRGIQRAFDDGIVTSASLMVRAAAAVDAAARARSRPGLAVGLHVDLGEWTYESGSWAPLYDVVDFHDPRAVADEVQAQLDAFVALTGRRPTHLDSHQHVHTSEPVRSVVRSVAGALGVPVRGCDERITHRGDFYGQDGRGRSYPDLLTLDAFERIVGSLAPGWSELGCHPGEIDDLPPGAYRDEREQELAVLCDPRARDVLSRCRVELASFAELPMR